MSIFYVLLRASASLLLLVPTLLSCTDHDTAPPTTQRNRLNQETVAYTNGAVFFTTKFEYSQSNQLVSTTHNFRYNNPGSSDTIQSDRGIYTYDGQNRLIRYDYHIDYHLFCCVKPLVYGRRTDIAYSTSGRNAIISEYQALSDFGDFTLSKTRRVELNLNSQISTDTTVYPGDPSEYVGIYTYANGNLVKAEYANSRTIYTYDYKPNPYYGLSSYLISSPPVQASKNNVVKQITESLAADGTTVINTTTTVYENIYAEKGLLVKSVSTITPVMRGTSFSPNTRLFTYEAY